MKKIQTAPSVLSALLLVGAMLLATAPAARAASSGIYNRAFPGAGCNCHSAAETTGVQVAVDGFPASYAPGETYQLDLSVIGPILPGGGFNLILHGGSLAKVDATVKVKNETECVMMEASGCIAGLPGNDCQVYVTNGRDETCPVWDPANPECKMCSRSDQGGPACRSCNGTHVLRAQAVHSSGALVPTWTVQWTAPEAGAGDVELFLVGNSVNNVLDADPADLWAFQAPNPRVSTEQ